ncbi:MAG: GGDEF domain-containing protein [Ruminococcus sp.]|nr:GGDEF domain-containing protein [Ruminococcus sp.]
MANETNNRRRIRIGLLLSHLEDDFDDAVCAGAMMAAKEHDVNLVVLPGRYIDGVYADKIRTEYEYQYNTLFELARDDGFDALLVLIGTLGSHLDKKRRTEFLSRFSHIPIITLTSQVDGYPCINVDNSTGLRQVIEHLIESHSCRNLGFVSGPMTSDDAVERFEVYKEVLADHGIEFDENKVVYGNFSKYVAPKVGELIDRCPGLDAIVCSNDQMAIGTYHAMEERGLKPGKDILVTGFDDDPAATELTPHLTTVAMDSTELGYNALIEAVNYINNGSIEHDTLSSSMIVRNSCGCTGSAKLNTISLSSDSTNYEEFAEKVAKFLFTKYRVSAETSYLRSKFAEIVKLIGVCVEHIARDEAYDPYVIFDRLEELIRKDLFDYISLEILYTVIEYVHISYSSNLQSKNSQIRLNTIFARIYRMIAEFDASICKEKLDDNYFMTWQTNSITRDMLIFDAYNDEAYLSVVDKLTRLHVSSSYLYCYDPVVINTKNDVWHYPEIMKLKAYHNMGEPVMLPAEKQSIRLQDIFTNEFFPNDRRYTMVCMPLFTNDEHYGLLICEMEHEYFNYLQSITVQLCAALKIISLMKQQSVIQKQLQQSLIEIRENNQLLGELSRQDELTGCFNRRGFFEKVRKLIRSNEGQDAIMIFADLDNLKTINDRFGHEEGDFAIRSVAAILGEAFTGDEVIGRIGGDEFVVCATVREKLTAAQIRSHVEELTKAYNDSEGRDKDYYVHASVGVYPFKCTDTVEINELLSHADALLYEQKKNKDSVFKSERKK